MPDEPLTLTKRLMQYFGLDMRELRVEWAKLTDADRAWFREEFNKMGLPTT